MKCTILGCGGSLGVPQIGCDCIVCTSNNTKNKRLRCSILIESETTSVLIDSSPDLRQQALVNNIKNIDAVVYTHAHYDHIAGLDDLKPFTFRKPDRIMDAFMTEVTYKTLSKTHFYAFEGHTVYKPFLNAIKVGEYDQITIGDINIELFKQNHGSNFNSLGIKVGNFAYSTDMNDLPLKSQKILSGIDNWVIDLLRFSWAPTHNNFEDSLNWIEKIQPNNAIFTHMLHEIDYDEINNMTPENVCAAFDGMKIDIKP